MTLDEVSVDGLVCEYKNCQQEGAYYNKVNRVVCKNHTQVFMKPFEELFGNPTSKIIRNQS